MSFDIVVVGSCNTDLISYVSRLPKIGETISGDSFQMGFGGKGANQCIAASKLGATVAMVAKVGNDIFGEQYVQNFVENNVSTEYVYKSCTSGTGKAIINVDKEGNNSIVIIKGANDELSVAEVEGVEDVIAKAKVLVCQLEIRQDVTLAALKLAKKHNVTTILNPAPVPACGLDLELIKHTDIFCPNETEAQLLTNHSFATIAEAVLGIKELAKLGSPVTIVTLGEFGCLCCCSGEEEVRLLPAFEVAAVDTTGAGDAFVGSLSYYLSRCISRDEAGKKEKVLGMEKVHAMVQAACGIASVSVLEKGTQSSYPKKDSIPPTLLAQLTTFQSCNMYSSY